MPQNQPDQDLGQKDESKQLRIPKKRLFLLVGGMLFCLLGMGLLNLESCSQGQDGDHPPVRSSYYYRLQMQRQELGTAVYRASGDMGKPETADLKAWIERASLLTRGIQRDQVGSDLCHSSAARATDNLQALVDQVGRLEAYKVGYQAWQQVARVEADCA